MKKPEPMIRWFMLSNLVANTAYSVCAPLLPLEFERHGIAASYVGATFALYSLGTMIVSPFVGQRVDQVGYHNFIGLALGSMGFAFFCFGFVNVMESKVNILILSFVMRLIHGIGCATQYTTSITVGLNEYKDAQESVIGSLQTMTALGQITGPILGSTLFSFLGF